MRVTDEGVRVIMTRLRHSDHTELMGIWLNPEQVDTSIEHLLLRMLEPTQPDLMLRQSILEELSRRVKRKEVVLKYLVLTINIVTGVEWDFGNDGLDEPATLFLEMQRDQS